LPRSFPIPTASSGCNFFNPVPVMALVEVVRGLQTSDATHVLLSVMRTIHDEFGDSKYHPASLSREMVDAGYLGRKTGRGVYRY
jgi:3-hydroxybutyryl-CoA dehydrogenase